MNEKRCPYCGRPNPADAEVCQHCHARLKQKLSSSPPVPPPTPEDELGWLRSLSGQPAPAEQSPVPPKDEDSPEWLERIRQRKQEEPGAVSPIGRTPRIDPEPAPEPEVTPDWLQELRPTSNTIEDSSVTGSAAFTADSLADFPSQNDNDDWLKSFNERLTGAVPGSDGPITPTSPSEKVTRPPEPVTPPAQPAAGEQLPDWLREIGGFEALAGSGLAGLDTQTQPEPAPKPTPPLPEPAEQEAIPTGEFPSWLKDIGSSSSAEAQPSEPVEIPPPGAFAAPPVESAPPEEEIPQWLVDFTDLKQGQEQAPTQPTTPAAESPEWLSDLAGLSSMAPAPSGEEPAGDAEIPNWLKDFNALPTAPPEPAPAPASPFTGAPSPFDIPLDSSSLTQSNAGDELDWMKTFSTESNAEAVPTNELPDFLKSMAPVDSQERAAPDIAPNLSGDDSAEVPDWLKAFEQAPAAEAPESAQAGTANIDWAVPATSGQPAVSPFADEGLPDWVPTQQAPAATPPPARRSPANLARQRHPFGGADLPEWLAKREEEVAPILSGKETPSDSIEMAQLPAWLQAMRPLESAAPGSAPSLDDLRVEKSGPLAGFRGVLPGEDLVTQYRKPPAYSARLRISERQQQTSALFESSLAEETTSQPVPAAPTQAPHYIVRLAAGLVLITLLLAMLILGLKPLAPPALNPQVQAFYDLQKTVQEKDPILLVFDYEAGRQGELRAAALPVVRHLMERQARLVIVSTHPFGPLLGEDLLLKASRDGKTAYPLKANLGYLLGGSTALRQFALPAQGLENALFNAQPLAWISIDENKQWKKSSILVDLNQVSAFKQVIVLTDSLEGGRDWIEQVQPELAKKSIPLAMISSAQAAPLLQSYLDSGQVKALLSGLSGGAAYEQLRQAPGDPTACKAAPCTSTWNTAYQVGMLFAVLLILIGGMASLLSGFGRRKAPKKA